jgi:NAD(P)H-hydrate repair Nnr-like enzyme with NAD(P)H-hydrate dehydratase domain
MLVLAGTVPIKDMPLTAGACHYEAGRLSIGDTLLEGRYVTLGTSAMASAATITCQTLAIESPYLVTIGDTGMGQGTVSILEYLTRELANLRPTVLTLHYLLPTKEPFKRLIDAVDALDPRPFFIADAGALLNAKAIGLANKFDLFTPDPGELSFLADKDAAHPAYVQYVIFKVDNTEIARLAKEASEHGDAPKYLLIKAATDHIMVDGEIKGVVAEPLVPALEPIGGTGDTITGIVSALISSGIEPDEACLSAARINRYMGEIVSPTPATLIGQLIPFIPEAIKEVLGKLVVKPEIPKNGGNRV